MADIAATSRRAARTVGATSRGPRRHLDDEPGDRFADAPVIESTARRPSTVIGILLCCAAISTFALQDAVTKVLASDYPLSQFLMLRFLVLLAFAIPYAMANGGFIAACDTPRPFLQLVRCLLLVVDIWLFTFCVQFLGLADIHALYATAPLMTTLLAPIFLGEEVGWRRYTAVAVGFLGALIIVRPGLGVFHWAGGLVLAAALCWSLYAVLTRMSSKTDSLATGTLFLALTGAAVFTPLGVVEWKQPDMMGWIYIAIVCITGVAGHMIFIKAFEYAPAVVLQPFNYLLLVWAIFYGLVIFGDFPDSWTLTGSAIIVASGLYVAWREWVRTRPARQVEG